MTAVFFALGSLATLIAAGLVARANRESLGSMITHTPPDHDGALVIRIDAPRVPVDVRRISWGLLVVAVLGIVTPLWLWTPETITPAAAMAWLAALGTLVYTLATYHQGWLWPALSQRLGVSADEVWWDEVDRHAQPGPRPTSVAQRVPRAATMLTFDDDWAVLTSDDGRGVVFGPLPEAERAVLKLRWENA